MFYKLSQNINKINSKLKIGKTRIIISYKKLYISILKCLQRSGLRFDYSIKLNNLKKIIILNFKNTNPFLLKSLNSSSKNISMKYKEFKNLKEEDKNNIILTTSAGILTGTEAFSLGLGGIPLFKLIYI